MSFKSHSSSKLLGTATALAAATTSGHGALVQITLSGNQLSLFTNNLNADLTGDGTNDITLGVNQVSNPPRMPSFSTTTSQIPVGPYGTFSTFTNMFTVPGSPGNYEVRANINGSSAIAGQQVSSLGAPNSLSSNAPGTGLPEGGINLIFTDANIFGGATTNAFLEVIASGASRSITLTRLVFDDGQGAPGDLSAANINSNSFAEFTPIPEPSGLALLALGAGGISLRRKRKVA